jgi:hypothetical protein
MLPAELWQTELDAVTVESGGLIGTVSELLGLHPNAETTVTPRATLPEAPAVNLIVCVPTPDVIVPPEIVHVYLPPVPAEGTEAVLPVELAHTTLGAVIVAGTVMVLVAPFVQPAAFVTKATSVIGRNWEPAVQAIVAVPVPDVITPLSIDQEYTAPAPASGT